MSYSPTVRNFISSLNSSTTPIAASGFFTGVAEDVSAYDSVVVAVKTDQDGIYSVQFSNDGTNWDSVLNRYYRTSQIDPPHRFTIARQYCRVAFNSTSTGNQSYFRLQTTYGEKAQLNIPIDSTIAQDYDALAVRPTDYHYEVALGRRQGATTWNKFGYNADVDVGTETVWAYGGTFVPMTGAFPLNIVSSSTGDNGYLMGSGTRGVVVYGVGDNYQSLTEVVTLSGTSPVSTTNSFRGVNRTAIYLAGAAKSNIGNITVTDSVGSSVQAYIPAGEGTSQQLIFFTQANHQALADWLLLNAEKIAGGSTPKVTFKGWVYSAVSNAKYEVFRQIVDTNVDDHLELTPSQPFVIGEKSIFYIEATTNVADTSVAGRFSLIEIQDVDA